MTETPEKSSTSTTTSPFVTITQLCGHTMKVLRLYALLGVRGICTACWVIVREELEWIEQQRAAAWDKKSELNRSKDPTKSQQDTSGRW